MNVIKLLITRTVIIFFISSCVVAKEGYNKLLSDFTELNLENKNLKKTIRYAYRR